MSYIKLADYVVNYIIKPIMSFEIKTNLMKNVHQLQLQNILNFFTFYITI
jgi:hypothetical protein